MRGKQHNRIGEQDGNPRDLCSTLQSIAYRSGFVRSWTSESLLSFSFGETAFPFWLVTQATSDDEFVIAGRVRTYNLAGCRTDLHDWIGALWTACLRVLNVSSAWVMDEAGFVSDKEIYGRYLSFAQPSSGSYSISRDADDIVRLFSASAIAAQAVSQVWCSSRISDNDEWRYDDNGLRCSRRKGKTFEEISGTRSNCLDYFRDCKADVSISDFRNSAGWADVFGFFDAPLNATTGETDAAHLLRSGPIRNVMWKKSQALLSRLAVGRLGAKAKDVRFVPCDSHLFAVSPAGLCSKRIESGDQAYAEQFELLRRRQVKNAMLLNQDTRFHWGSRISPNRFEELIHRILEENPEVLRVKQIGHANESDGGRDFIMDVRRSFLRRVATPDGEEQSDSVRIIVQCKTSDRNVGKGVAADIRDTVDRHGAFGFLLIAFPGVTRSVVDYVEEVRTRGLFWIEHWTKTDLEAQLRAIPEAAAGFDDVVTVIAPRRTE